MPQHLILFNKRKFGLFKTENIIHKHVKHKIATVFFSLKNDLSSFSDKKTSFIKKHKFIFYKKLNKGFYRSGRSLLIKQLNLKKYTIQKYINKKLYSLVKKPQLNNTTSNTLLDTLLYLNLFYSIYDAETFIRKVGILLNFDTSLNPNQLVKINTLLSLPVSVHFVKFFKKNKHKILTSVKKSKFYKYRAKYYFARKNFK